LNAVAQVLVEFAPLILAGAIPFQRVLRGGGIGRWFLICWISLIAWTFVFSLIIPAIVLQIDHDLKREISGWFPDGTVVAAMLFFGWFYAGITVCLALLVKKAFRSFRQRTELAE
jgi:hypothetical protein